MSSQTPTNIAWYYVGVLALMLFGQNFLLNTAHKEAIAKLAAKSAPAPIVASAAPAAAAPATSLPAAPAAATAVPAPAVVQATAPAAAAPVPAPVSTLKAEKPAPKSKPIVASAAPQAGAKALPVRVAYRTEPFQKGKIVTLTNTSKDKVNCTLRVSRPGTGKAQQFPVTLAASGETRVVGSKDWSFKSGDVIELAQSGYKPTTTSVP